MLPWLIDCPCFVLVLFVEVAVVVILFFLFR